MGQEKSSAFVLDASTYVGFWILRRLSSRGYLVHAAIRKNGQSEIEKKIKDMEMVEERLVVYDVNVFDYQSILVSLRGCKAVFCCLGSQSGYDDREVDLEVRGVINVVEACAQTDSIEKVVFSSSLTAAIWGENIGTFKDVDERFWSDEDFCRSKKNGVLAYVDSSTCGRYFRFDRVVNTQQEALKLLHSLYEEQGTESYAERLRNKKLRELVEAGTALLT